MAAHVHTSRWRAGRGTAVQARTNRWGAGRPMAAVAMGARQAA